MNILCNLLTTILKVRNRMVVGVLIIYPYDDMADWKPCVIALPSITSIISYVTSLKIKIHNSKYQLVQSLSRVWQFVTPWTEACQASLSITNSQRLLKLMSIESVMPSNHLMLCRPLRRLPSIFPSMRVFSNESVLHILHKIRWPKYWSFSFSISPSNEYSGLISFRIDWLDLLAVQRALKSLGFFWMPRSHQCKVEQFWVRPF